MSHYSLAIYINLATATCDDGEVKSIETYSEMKLLMTEW